MTESFEASNVWIAGFKIVAGTGSRMSLCGPCSKIV
jgi:hypothetical protein